MKKTLLVTALICAIGLMVYLVKFTGHAAAKRDVSINGVILPRPSQIVPFALQGAERKKYSEQDLKGHWTLIFFGYLTCPDICPTTLATLAQVFAKSEFDKDNVQIWFISVDPERDEPTKLQEYVGYFNHNFVGLTGIQNQIKQLTSHFGIPYFIQADANNYVVDHGSQIIVVNPKGQYHAVLTAPHVSSKLTLDLENIIKSSANL